MYSGESPRVVELVLLVECGAPWGVCPVPSTHFICHNIHSSSHDHSFSSLSGLHFGLVLSLQHLLSASLGRSLLSVTLSLFPCYNKPLTSHHVNPDSSLPLLVSDTQSYTDHAHPKF